MRLKLIPAFVALSLALTACEPSGLNTPGELPDTIKTKDGNTVNVKNALKIDMNKAQLAMESTTRETAVASLAKFCKNGQLKLSTIENKLKSAGYLDLGESAAGDVTIWAHPSGSSVMGTGARPGGAVICFAMMARSQANADKMEPLIKSKLNPRITRIPFKLPKAEGAWQSQDNPRHIYMLIKDKRYSGLAYATS